MKKIEIKGKLSLNKSTIATLNDEQMNALKGGAKTWSLFKCSRTSCSNCTVCAIE